LSGAGALPPDMVPVAGSVGRPFQTHLAERPGLTIITCLCSVSFSLSI
jgi:hypothetical protein